MANTHVSVKNGMTSNIMMYSTSYAQAAVPMSTCELSTTITIITIVRLTLSTCVWCLGSPVGFYVSNKLFCGESVIAIRSQFHCVCPPSLCFVWPLRRKKTQNQNSIAKFGPYVRAMSCSPRVLRVEEVVRDETCTKCEKICGQALMDFIDFLYRNLEVLS
jgi:hypothetical protein